MGFKNILSLSVLLLVMLADRNAQADIAKFPCGYNYFSEARAWFKMHTDPVSWLLASNICHWEGGQLATPTSEEILNSLLSLIRMTNYDKYIENKTSSMLIHLGRTPEGVERELALKITQDIALTEKGHWEKVSQYTSLPYICYKKAPNVLQLNECDTTDPDYELDSRTNQCYKFHRNQSTWYRAAEICATEGGYLTIINSEEEAEVIKDIYARNPTNVIPGNDDRHKNYAHIGFWCSHKGGVWKTLHGEDLSEAGYEGWFPGEPNYSRVGERCGNVGRDGKLLDAYCFYERVFICEKDVFGCDECKHDSTKKK